MGLMDVLEHYTNRDAASNPNAHDHFDEVARSISPDVMGQGVADAFRADETPPFPDMVSQMYGRSNPLQQAGLLNQLIRAIGPSVLSAIGGGVLGRMSAQPGAGLPQVTPQQAQQVTPQEVQEIARRAEERDPSVLDKVGGFYAQHPDLVKTLGGAALAIALAGISNRMRNR